MLNLPYVASLVQLQFHLVDAFGADNPVLFGGAMVGGKTAGVACDAIREAREVANNRVLIARRELVTFRTTTLPVLMQFMPDSVIHRPSASMFQFPNGSIIHYTGLGSEKDKSKIQGSEWGAIYIDEAHQIEYPTFLMAGTRLRWRNAALAGPPPNGRLKMRLTCNPEPGWIKDMFIANAAQNPGYTYIPALPTDNPYRPAGYIETMRRQLPDEWFRAYMEGDWNALVPTNVVLSTQKISTSFAIEVGATDEAVLGLDVARFGDDKTVLAMRQGGLFTVLMDWENTSVTDTVRNVLTFISQMEEAPQAIFVDDEGVGGGVTDGLRDAAAEGKMGGCGVVPVVANNRPQDTEHFSTMKAELWFALRRFMDREPVSFRTQNDLQKTRLKAGLEAHRYDVVGGRARITPKPLVKRQIGFSPDEADAVVLTMFERPDVYVSYTTEEEALLAAMDHASDEDRDLLMQSYARRQRAQRTMNNFANLVRQGRTIDRPGGY